MIIPPRRNIGRGNVAAILRSAGLFGVGTRAGSSREPYLGVVATRCMVPTRQNTGITGMMSRSAHIAREKLTSIKIVTPNWIVNEFIVGVGAGDLLERNTGSIQTRTASIEYPAGTFKQVKWSGATQITEVNGSTNVSDFCNVDIPTGATFFVNMFTNNASGIIYYNDTSTSPANVALGDKTDFFTGIDKTLSSFTDTHASSGYINVPLAIIGMTSRSSAYLIGSSRVRGIQDVSDASGDLGILARPIGPNYGYIQAGVSGGSIANFISSHANRVALAQYVSHVFVEGPVNDDISNETTIEGTLQTIWGYFTSNTIVACTCNPQTTSTDNWATAVNQTITKNFTTVNAYIMGQPAPLRAAFDLASASSTSQKWKVDGTAFKYTADGVHESQFANLAIPRVGLS